MLRLDPAHPPLWRSATSLQFGLDAVARLDAPAPWQERLIRQLERGLPEPAFDGTVVGLGGTVPEARDLLRMLAPALSPDARPLRPRAVLDVPDDADAFDAATVRAFTAAMRAAGRMPLPASSNDRTPVILLACHAVDPRRVVPLMSRDVPHLPVVFTADRVEVGPLVVPGRSACLTCVQLDERDRDADWPHLFAQLLDRRAIPAREDLALEAGLLAAGLLGTASGSGGQAGADLFSASAEPTMPSGRSVRVRAGSLRRRWHVHRPHAECRCRSLAGSATASAPAVRSTATMTARASARRA